MTARDVFISHSKEDKAIAHTICTALESAGLSCWIAPRNITPGSDWTNAIVSAIAECRFMVLVFSAATNASDHVPREVLHALEKRRYIFPFRIADVPPSGAIAYTLVGVQWFDAFEPPIETHIASLAAQIRLLAASSEPIPPILPSPDPSEEPARTSQDNPDDIYFLCGQCGQRLVIAAEAAGMSITCPHCSSPVTVPSGDEPRDIFDLPLSDAALATLERCLAAVVGPIGTPLAKNAVAQASTAEELQEMLLACIPSANDQQSFLKACREASKPAPAQNESSASSPEKSAPGLDDATVAALTRSLAAYIGPIASIMVRRALPEVKTSAELCVKLAASIQDEKDREKFLQSVPPALR